MEFYDPDANSTISLLNLPIKLYKSELEKTINEQLGEVIYEDDDYSDGLMIKATKQADISMYVSDHKVSYKVPIKLWVKKDVILTSVTAEGALDLEFETAYDVKPDWELETKTSLTRHEWTKAPIVKLGFGNLNVESIANQFIGQAAKELTSSIDKQVKKLIDLKSEVAKAWEELQEPILVSDEYKTWLIMNTDSVRLTPLNTIGEMIESTVIISARPRMMMGNKPEVASKTSIPNFKYAENTADKNFAIYLGSEIPFAEAERIARQNMVGETYSYGKRKVTVEAIELRDQGNKLAVKTTLSGSYVGDVTLIGRPEYHDRKNEIVLKNVDFDFSAKRTLMKTASWLFKSPLKKTIQENLNFHLNENLLLAQKAIETELENFELGPGIKIISSLEELNVSHVYINTKGINVKVGMTGELALEVSNFMGRK
ncbi:MAG: DUF4403 family protein [Bacteroidota bacterium]